jgi:predicted nuclease of restriction endonuclease-like (RecB) superfamily
MRDYPPFLAEVLATVKSARLRAAQALTRELVELYWELGRLISERQQRLGWGDGVVDRLSRDLKREFPGMTGFSSRNLRKMKQLYDSYRSVGLLAAAAAKLPWDHNVLILGKVTDPAERLWYVQECARQGWSRNVLRHQIESKLYRRLAKLGKLHNFDRTLPHPQSELAAEILKDPYHFGFLGLGTIVRERDLERGLTANLEAFLLELGVGFAFVGRQVRLAVEGRDYFVDLLFYHLRLRCLVAIELKMDDFAPEDAGKMNFYLSALDDLVKHPDDAPAIGMILCRERGRTAVEYALRDLSKPIGVAAWRLTNVLPDELRGSLPDPEQLEEELRRIRP